MKFLPIVERELRVAARRRSTYRVRSYAGLVVVLGGAWLFLVMHGTAQRHVAEDMFAVLAGCAVFFGLMSGCFSTADCLSEEKREGTLGLLFLTDLKSYDVVLGKLVGNSLNAFYTMAAVVPLLAVPLMLGGLTPGDFMRMALVALDALFFSLAAGIFVSSVFRSSGAAVGLTFLLVLMFTAILPISGAMIAWRHSASHDVHPVFLLSSAFYAYALAPDQEYRLWATRFWGSLALIHGFGWLFLILASAITPHRWQDRPAVGSTLRWRDCWQRFWAGDAGTQALPFRRELLTVNPFLWLAARARYKPVLVWGGLAAIGCGWLIGLASYGRDWWTEPGYYVLTGFCVHLFLRLRFAAEAPSQMAEERKAGTLELLLCTPLTVPDIVEGQRLSMQQQFLGPTMLVMCLDFVAMFAPSFVSDWNHWGSEGQGAWIAFWAGALVLLALDFWALFWIGAWQGLTAKTGLRAASNALGNLFMAPCVIYALFLLWLVLDVTSRRFRGGPQLGPWSFFCVWYILRIVTDICVGAYTREKLLRDFRLAAQQKRDPRPGMWGAMLGTLWKGQPNKSGIRI